MDSMGALTIAPERDHVAAPRPGGSSVRPLTPSERVRAASIVCDGHDRKALPRPRRPHPSSGPSHTTFTRGIRPPSGEVFVESLMATL